jgi:hypothetical protein
VVWLRMMQLIPNLHSCFLFSIDNLVLYCLDLFSHLLAFVKSHFLEKCVVEASGCLKAKSVKKSTKKWIMLVFKFHWPLNLNSVKEASFQFYLSSDPGSTVGSHFIYFTSFCLCYAWQECLNLFGLQGRIGQTLSFIYFDSDYGRMKKWQLTDF